MASYTVFGKREIEETLENFNQQQQRDDKERLEPVDQWSSTIIDKLALTEDHGLLSVDAKVVKSQILPTTDNKKTKEALWQFFVQYLNEVKFFRCIEHIKAILFVFLSDRNTKRKIELLKQRIDILNTMKPTLTGDELERSIRDLQNLPQFHQSLKELPDWCSLDFKLFDIFAALLKLSPALLPIREDLVQVFKKAGLLEYVFDKICISKITEIRCTEKGERENVQTENVQTENVQTENVQTENVQTENAQTENVQTENAQTENAQTENAQTENAQKGLPAVSPALRMLSSLAVFDSRARNTIGGSTEVHDAIRPKEKVSWETLKKTSSPAHAQKSSAEQLHPVDVLFASFLCCDAEVKQFLCQRLFQCKLAFPFLYANEFNELVQSDWILGDIALEFEGSDRELKRICLGSAFAMQSEKQSITDSLAHQQQAPVVDETSTSNNKQLPVISFLRTGDLKVSKSQILNKLLSSETLDTHVFFHRECTNGKALRICSSGLVEAAVWFKKPVGDKHHQATPYLVLNLRGDAKKHDAQTEKMAKLSQCCVLFGYLDEFSKPETVKFVETLHQKAKNLLLFVLESLKEVENKDAFQKYADLQLKTEFLVDNSPSVAEICSTVHSALDEILSPAGDFQQMPRVQEAVKLKDFPDSVMNSAREVFSYVMSGKFGRKNIFALQSLAESHAHTDGKKVFRYFKLMAKLITSGKDPESVLTAQQKLYQSQVTAYKTNGTFLANFVTQLHELHRTKAVFVKISLFSLKFALDEHSFNQNEKLLEAEKELKRCPDSDFNKKKRLEEYVEKAKNAYFEASIDLNCLLREVGLLFESYAHQISETKMPDQIQRLPGIFASLLLSGMPIELLDGTLGNIPMKWISAVLLECKRQAGDKKIFVVSVLGVQSSGKSTLLNTMFGMRLPVSAGRCTRGAFLQLVHADQRSKLPFDYLAVIDTEGLMSVEEGSDNYFRDSEFATLVIGLADVTLITVNGEDSPEMRNVLPIVIKAFIQMMQVNKELKLKRHCIFTHQHVSEPTAGHRMQSGISARQDKLEKFTKAESIKAGLREKSFSDIISFSPESDVFLLPGLWLGNPPADPVNTVYSEKVQALKQRLIQLSKDHVPLLSFEDFACRIEDIWNAVLTQDFVFSYRNSIERKAFDELEVEFKKIALEFEKEVYEFSRKRFTSRESNIHSQKDLNRSEKEIRDEMPKAIESAFKEAEKKLNKYFQESERKEYISQHHCDRMSALVTKKEALDEELSDRLREFVKVQNVRINQNAKIETVKKKLKESADELNMTNQSQLLSDEQIQKHFDKFWTTEALTISEDSAVPSEPIEKIVRNCAMEALQFNQDCSWTAKITLKPSEPEKLKDLSEVILHGRADELYEVKRLARGLFVKHQNVVLDAVKCILYSIGPILSELSEKNRSFWKSDAEKVVKKVCCEFEETSGRLSGQIVLTNKLKEAVVVYACRLAYPTFKQMETRFAERFSLKSKLEKEKEQLLKFFKGHVSKLRHSIMAADDVLDALKKVLTRSFEETIDKIPGKCLEHLQASMGNKAGLIKKLLVHGIESDQQILCSYILSPKQAAVDFLKMQVQGVLFDKNGHDSLYKSTIDTEFFKPSRNAIKNAFTAANRAKNDNTSTSVTEWLKVFCDTCNEFEFPLSIKLLDASLLQSSEVDLTEFLESFTDKKAFELIESFREKTVEGRQDYDNIPGMKKAYQDAISYFWGCDHCCPLCNEPCIRMEADHVTEDKASSKHRCIRHRPMGLTGEKLESRHEFAPYACGYFSTGISQSFIARLFRGFQEKRFKCHQCSINLSPTEDDQEADTAPLVLVVTEQNFHRCSEYKKCFPDWDIEPTFWAPVSNYWKWIAWKHRDSLMETSKEYAQIPDAWKEVTSEKALESLNKNFAE